MRGEARLHPGALIAPAMAFAALLTPSPVRAASNITARFDGVYRGQARVVAEMSTGACAAFTVPDTRIARGLLATDRSLREVVVSGFITEEGYVQASLTRAGGPPYPLDGRFEDGVISAGLIDPVEKCAWVIELRRATEPE